MRLYAVLMWLILPPDFRLEFGDEICRSVRARLASADGAGRVGVWVREVADLLRTGVREWTAFLGEVAGVGTSNGTGGDGMMRALGRDVRFALRTLARAPMFTAVVVVTLALGIGANSAIFSVVDAVLLEGLPYDEPDRLVNVWQDATAQGGPEKEWFNYADAADLAAEPNLLAASGTWNTWQPTLASADGTTSVPGLQVSHEVLDGVFRARTHLGRVFTEADDVPGAPGVVVLTYDSWQNRFGGDPSVVGRALSLSEVPHTVVGVLEPGFRLPMVSSAEMIRAQGVLGELGCLRGCFGTRVVGRLAPGVTLDAAHARARALGDRLAAAYPETNTNLSFNLVGMREDMTGDSRRALWVLLGGVGFVLLIACTNVANLLLSRAATRRGEMSVRVALGAGRGRLLRQMLTESLVLALAGGAAGLALAWWGTDVLLGMAPPGTLPRMEEIGLDGGVLAFTAAVTVVTGLLFGLVPSWRAARADVHAGIRAAGRGGQGGGARLRSALAVVQIGLALVLLVGSGLLIRSFERLNSTELGFEPDGVLTMQVNLPSERYADGAERQAFFYTLLDRIRAVPGVERAAMTNSLPLAGFDGDAGFIVEGEAPPPPGVNQSVWIRPVSEGYLGTVGTDLLAGRDFEAGDDGEAPRVLIVNQTLASRYFAGDAVGKRIAFGGDPENANWRTIVGVARDVRHFGLREPIRPAAYLPYRQVSFPTMSVVARTSGDPEALVPDVRRTLASLDASLAAANVQPMRSLVDAALAPDRFVTILLGLFALTALLLAAVGIYGVISYGVTRRYREMGIRLALGADGGSVRGLVLRGGVGLALVGIGVGVVAALAMTRVLQSLLYEVEATDPATFVATTAVLAGVAVLASWIPAMRASRADPVRVLREE